MYPGITNYPLSNINEVTRFMDDGKIVICGMGADNGKSQGAHAVVLYAYERLESGEIVFSVYDNNYPNLESKDLRLVIYPKKSSYGYSDTFDYVYETAGNTITMKMAFKLAANKAEVCVRIDQRVIRLCEEFHVAEDAPFRYMFIKSIFSCMVTLFSPKCPLTGKEKCAYIRQIVNDEYILSRCRGGAGGAAGKAVGAVLSSKSVLLNYCAAGFAAGFGSAFPELFRKIKHKK